MKERDVFDSISPADYRYWDKEIAAYLSENAFTRYKLEVERALMKVLTRRKICNKNALAEVEAAIPGVTTEEVYIEEDKTHHDIRALVNCIRKRVSDSTKPFIHLTATSQDIIDSANAARYRDAIIHVLLPRVKSLMKVLIEITLREANSVQIGRTHGQHAVPITFGFALAGYVSRIGYSYLSLNTLTGKLVGKFSGAVGAHNASSLLWSDPESFEREVLLELGLEPAEHSTQISPPEPVTRLFCEMAILAGILGNLSDDMRHLQRTEIAEVGEEFEDTQVGSSTMPQKQNPINFENTKSCWKIVMPRLITIFIDQISEHQRDLTNSASARTYAESIAYLNAVVKRITRVMQKLKMNKASLRKNLLLQKDFILAEPLSIIYSRLGHPHAHEKIRRLSLQAKKEEKTLIELVKTDEELGLLFGKMTVIERYLLSHPETYIGTAAQKAQTVARRWAKELDLSID